MRFPGIKDLRFKIKDLGFKIKDLGFYIRYGSESKRQ
jgi:hypothetical protein